MILLDNNLDIINKVVTEFDFDTPHTGWSEQDPGLWWREIKKSLKQLLIGYNSEDIAAIGLSGQMHGLELLDKNYNIIRPAILWNDQRSESYCNLAYKKAGGRRKVISELNNPWLPAYFPGKLLWLKENEPENFHSINKIICPKDYIRYCLTGKIATDYSDASGTGLLNISEGTWSSELIEKLGFSISWFPTIESATSIAGSVLPDLYKETSLNSHTAVTYGGGDAVMQTIGSGCLSPNEVLIVLGTGGNVTISTNQFKKNDIGNFQSFRHTIPDNYIVMGVTNSAGNSLKWYRDNLADFEKDVAKKNKCDIYKLLDRDRKNVV